MALTTRQTIAYRDLVDLYEPVDTSVQPGGGLLDPELPPTPTKAGVPCLYQPTPNFNLPRTPGRTKETNIFTSDSFHMEMALAALGIGDGWFLQLKTVGHPLYGVWWVAQGDPQVVSGRNNRANKLMVYAVITPKPEGH